MGVSLGDGTPKALRVWLEQIEKHPPTPVVVELPTIVVEPSS